MKCDQKQRDSSQFQDTISFGGFSPLTVLDRAIDFWRALDTTKWKRSGVNDFDASCDWLAKSLCGGPRLARLAAKSIDLCC